MEMEMEMVLLGGAAGLLFVSWAVLLLISVFEIPHLLRRILHTLNDCDDKLWDIKQQTDVDVRER